MVFGLTLTALWAAIFFAALASIFSGKADVGIFQKNKNKLLLAFGGVTCIVVSYWMMWLTLGLEPASSKTKVGGFVGGIFIMGIGLPQVICALAARDETCRKFLRFLYKSNEANGQ